jgi:uroporphyrinogen decarboxylase
MDRLHSHHSKYQRKRENGNNKDALGHKKGVQRMTPKQRMITAMKGGTPDRVPAAPDISNMIPAKLTGKPFWDIYYRNDPPLWKAYIDAAKRYGIDGWFTYDGMIFRYPAEIREKREVLSHTLDRLTVRHTYATPAGDLTEVWVYPAGDPPTRVEKMIKDFERDYPKFAYFQQTPTGYDAGVLQAQVAAMGEHGIVCAPIMAPGLHIVSNHFEGGLEAAIYAMMDYPELFEELIGLGHRRSVKQCELAIEAGVESVLTGGSGSITMASPELWRKHSLRTIQEITKMCKRAGVLSGIHSCGYEMMMVETCARETDLDYINPLEIPPMGDCTLLGARERAGAGLCLMGNLHTTSIMLNGSTRDVRRESLRAVLDAGRHGAFVLSTGDQCGRDTPEENLYEMVRVAEEFGAYPLDIERIEAEWKRSGGESI